ncbi:MAG: protein kinase domain-containing protein [Bryobacteraceae bacterium]
MVFEIGQVVNGYEILSELGKGGMGRVYRVRNIISNRVEAMKILLPDFAPDAELTDRFVGEIRTLARLEHPNIAKFHTAFKLDNQLVMIMECVEGLTLADQVKQAAIPLPEALNHITQVLSALAYAHENGVIHRDIKPSNVMITPHGIVKLMDFGIAKSTADPLTTRSGATIGSILYMSPEQVRGTAVDARSDLYSVGVLLYELTAGRRPFDGENTFAILDRQLNTTPQPPIELNPSLPPALNEIIMTALAKEPSHRFQNAVAFRNALQNVSDQQTAAQAATLPYPVALGPPNSAQKVLPQATPAQSAQNRSHRSLWMASGAVACVCVLIGAVVLMPHVWNTLAANRAISSKSTGKTTNERSPQAPSPAGNQAVTPVGNGSTQPSAAPGVPAENPSPQNKMDSGTDNGNLQFRSQPDQNSRAVDRKAVRRLSQNESVKTEPSPPQPTPPLQPNVPDAQQPQTVAPETGPSQDERESLNSSLIQLQARAEAVKSTLDRLGQQQAASGLGLRQDIAASANRLDGYLQAAERALQNNTVRDARKNMDRADGELNKLEAFLGK